MSIGWYAVLGHGAAVCGIFAAVQDAAVHLGMQRLYAAVEHFRKAGEFGDVLDRDAGVAQQLGGATSGDEIDSECGELAREVGEAGLVGDTEDGALDLG